MLRLFPKPIFYSTGIERIIRRNGSGKSVILDSVNFVLGCKADRTMIRYGEYEAFVKAEFSVEDNSEAVAKLENTISSATALL